MNHLHHLIHIIVADIFHYPCAGLKEFIRRKSPIRPVVAIDLSGVIQRINKFNIMWAVLTDEFLGKYGIDSITTITKKHPPVKIAVITASENLHHLRHLESLGVNALIHKSTLGYEIKEAILSHTGKEIYLCSEMSKIYYRQSGNPSARKKILSDRQREIIPLLIEKYTREQIAEKLEIGVASVNTQCARIYEKQARFGFKTLLDLARADGIII
jgi:DNA-binding NarL/FixJ family response regulator